jgi:hypothetical protein
MLRRQLSPLSVIHDFLITEPSFKEGASSGILNFVSISPPGKGATQIRIPLQFLHIFSSHEIKNVCFVFNLCCLCYYTKSVSTPHNVMNVKIWKYIRNGIKFVFFFKRAALDVFVCFSAYM